ncbi:MAG: GGDEF domain-containing protein [Rhodobacteraceae bacterium]|nr:GGDEF domain-containing protein [Paracoccaceae bacterium]
MADRKLASIPALPGRGILAGLRTVHLVAVLPAIAAGLYFAFGTIALILLAAAAPVLALVISWPPDDADAGGSDRPVNPRARIESVIAARCVFPGRTTACLVVHADDLARLAEQLGPRAAEVISDTILERLSRALRTADTILRLDAANFAVVLAPAARFDLETMLQVAGRLQAAASEPVEVDATRVRPSLSVGFAQVDRVRRPGGAAVLSAAESAMLEARAAGAGSIRAYSAEMQVRRDTQFALQEEVRDALETGEIRAWFQPQISTDTGRVSGFEALARWHHPKRGMVAPGEFLPVIEAAGRMERLGQVMLVQALEALRAWDRAGHSVPSVGVNLSSAELADPALPRRIAWELDRFDLTPGRLTLEILESVISNAPDDIVVRNIAALAELGCGIDLDDFGTGNASITSIRRFAIRRIKIDRSFVARLDTDREQQRMVSAILTMCERLELGSVAEGVETPGEHAMLAQLGCGHVQGFGIARPMPFDDTGAWLSGHAASLTAPPSLGRKLG